MNIVQIGTNNFNEEDVEYKFLYTIKENVPDNYTEVSSFKISHLYAHRLEPDQIQKYL